MIKLMTLPVITVSVGGTAVQVSTDVIAVTSLTLQAAFNNTGKVVVGDSTVTPAIGMEVPPGDTVTITADNISKGSEEFLLSEVWINSSTAGNTVRAAAFRRKP